MPDKPPTELEHYWKEQWCNAKLDLETARAHVQAVQRSASPDRYGADTGNLHKSALEKETAALVSYSRILRIYTDLVVHGKMPDSNDWRQSASAEDDGQ